MLPARYDDDDIYVYICVFCSLFFAYPTSSEAMGRIMVNVKQSG